MSGVAACEWEQDLFALAKARPAGSQAEEQGWHTLIPGAGSLSFLCLAHFKIPRGNAGFRCEGVDHPRVVGRVAESWTQRRH